MLNTVRATVENGEIRLLEGANLLVTIIPTGEAQFWLQASEHSLDSIWDNEEDNVYEELLGVENNS